MRARLALRSSGMLPLSTSVPPDCTTGLVHPPCASSCSGRRGNALDEATTCDSDAEVGHLANTLVSPQFSSRLLKPVRTTLSSCLFLSSLKQNPRESIVRVLDSRKHSLRGNAATWRLKIWMLVVSGSEKVCDRMIVWLHPVVSHPWEKVAALVFHGRVILFDSLVTVGRIE